MIAVIQRVSNASVEIEGNIYNEIGKGLLVLAGICREDADDTVINFAKRITDLRIFGDVNEKMNLSVRDIDGEVLVISQFTLCTEKNKSGNRPSFTNAAPPEIAEPLYDLLVREMKMNYAAEKIKTGVFAAKMKVSLLNDGPVTIIMEK